MTDTEKRGYYIGPSAAVRQELESLLGIECLPTLPDEAARDDLVFIDVTACQDANGKLPGGNAFTACRRVKDRTRARVFLLVEAGDTLTPEIARFCLADDTIALESGRLAGGAEVILERLQPQRKRLDVDALLARLEKEIASDVGRQSSVLQRMLAAGGESTVFDDLTDSETGLFDGPYASFKLDEEFKRSQRFHQPLSLLLLDIGVDPESCSDRQQFLAEVASVFLTECRDIDLIARFTADTFMVLMPGTGPDGAELMAKRMLEGVRQKIHAAGANGSPCGGLATMPAAGMHDRQVFMARAEACLRLARDGRGQEGFCSSSE